MPIDKLSANKTSENQSYLNNIEHAFGRLPNELRKDFISNQARTHNDLSDALLERLSAPITDKITGLLTYEFWSPYTSFLLPYLQQGAHESVTIKWNEMHFNEGVAARLQDEGVPRLHTYQKTARSDRIVRRGAAVQIEAGFFNSPEGRKIWALQLKQIAAVVQKTNEFDVMLAILNATDSTKHSHQLGGNFNFRDGGGSMSNYRDGLEAEIELFGLVNKTPDSRGLINMITRYKTIMMRNGVTPDAIIVPPYMMNFYAITKTDLWDYSSAGESYKNARSAAGHIAKPTGMAGRSIEGLNIVDTHIYRSTTQGAYEAADMLTVPKQIGEYYPMQVSEVYPDVFDFEGFSSKNRNIQIFNEKFDNFRDVLFSDAIEHSFRWDQGNNLGSKHGRLAKSRLADMFVFDNSGTMETVKKWGDIEEKFLSDSMLKRVVATMVTVVKKNLASLSQAEATIAAFTIDTGANPDEYLTVFNQVAKIVGNIIPDGLGVSFKDVIKELVKDKDRKFKSTNNNRSRQTVVKRAGGLGGMCMALFLHSDVTKANMLAMHESNMFVPVDFLLCRPYMTFEVSSVVILKSGSDTGNTYVGWNNFMLTNNVAQKMIFGSYTYYAKAVVRNPENIAIAQDVFIQNYKSGADTTWIKDASLTNISQDGGLFDKNESMMAIMIPAGGTNDTAERIIDIRGKHAEFSPEHSTHDSEFHPSANYYSAVLGIDNLATRNVLNDRQDFETRHHKANTICVLGSYKCGPGFKNFERNKSHLGSILYAGCAASRSSTSHVPLLNIAAVLAAK